ncbi:unnamed protein product [Paramecium primaurelia]|uniref:ABC transporter domain-containing protein n=1 Tax=Paramecium primaurelia TaxID=5886 RepID=A0A8S1MJN0_PARPR|nr:unnamed protein product [Paramecium primaurelia]
MGHLSALLRKNWILWKRNCFCSTCELILPLLLILALGGIRSAVEKEDVAEANFYDPNNLKDWRGSPFLVKLQPYIDEQQIEQNLIQYQLRDPELDLSDNLKKLNTTTRLRLLPPMKNCIDNYRQDQKRMWRNGDIAMGPSADHPIVKELSEIFTKYYHYNVVIFKNNEELDDYTSSSKYGDPDYPRVCFGVMFNETQSNVYDYQLRFNSSGMINNEIPPTNFVDIDPIKYEDLDKANTYLESGLLTVQNFIDNIIIRREVAADAKITPTYSFIHRREGVIDDFATFLRGGFGIYLILPLMIIYLRMTYGIIYEKEKKLREGMKMMGLNNTSFYLSWIIQYFIIYTLISIVATILLKGMVFRNTDGFVLFINYWLFCMVLIFQSMFISVFFTRALFGLIVAIVWYLLMYMVISLIGSGQNLVPEATYWGASVSSHAGMSFAFDVMILFEAQGRGVSMSTIGTKVENYAVNMALSMHILNIFFYLFMSIYLDLVFPNEWGKKLHPLFCIPYFNKPHKSEQLLNRKASQIHQERYEEVEQALKDQETRKEVLQIQNLTKIYPSGKQAVSNVNLTMYIGQIYALLGHNGAGKTTTISMLTGLLDITEGSATVFGLDVETQIEEIRQFMGVCPQHDILFDNLTVKEHLEMFATFKGMKPEEIPAAVRRMIEDVDLLEKTDYLSKNLSGGQKRRLSVAMAFIGNSKLIYLDEPTSGMDTSARRYIWEMLKNYKEDRIIVLTTHFMDEADFLGDRIGIMGEGKLQCSGSSVFLKNQFGNGYNLTIVKESTLADSEPIIEAIQKVCPESILISKVSAEILLQLPLQAIQKFPSLFAELDKNLKSLHIQSYGISITTLEEVFLKVAQIGAGHHQVNEYMEKEGQNQAAMQIDDFDINQIRIISSVQLFFNHTLSLIIKRSRYFKRDIRSLCCEILLPCLVVLLGLILMTIEFITEPEIVLLTPPSECYSTDINYLWGGINDQSLFKHIQMNVYDEKQQVFGDASLTNLGKIDQNYFDTSDLRTDIGWYYLTSNTNNDFQYYMFVNSIFREGPVVMVNQMNQAILKKLKGDNYEIKVTNSPMRRTFEELQGQNTVTGFLAALVFSMGMAFIPASIISYIVKEREINLKHQQLVSGVSVKAYWFSNWLMDVGKHIIPSVVCCLLILAFDITAMIEEENYGFSWLIFFLYGWSMIPFCYLFSFLFRQQGNAMLLSFFLHLVVGSIISLVVYILRLIKSTRDIAKILQWIFRFIPSFSFAYGIVNSCSKATYKVLEGWTETKSTYDIEVAGADLIFLAFTGVLYIILVFIIEYFEDNGQLQKLGSSEQSIPYIPKPIDDDVAKENQLCETYQPNEKAILVKKLRKVFMLGAGKHKVAVDQVSFAIDQGEVFGLLGVNGAGKTTTFKILSGELKPTFGEAYIAGKSVIDDLEAARVNIGYCPQFDALLDNLTVREHIELFSDIKGIPYFKKEDLVEKKLSEMDLKRFENIQAGQLSGGNKRKLSVAIAMIGNPPIVFLDEPSTGMDPEARRFMWNVISRIATQRKQSTIILTTHSMEEAEALSTKIAIQVNGNLRCLGSVQHIKNKFGKGYEIEVKLEKPITNEINGLIAQMQLHVGSRLDQQKTVEVLRQIGQAPLEQEINMRGSGSHIYNDLRKPNGLAIETLAEFIIVEGMGRVLMDFIMKSYGQFEIIEHFQTFYRFRLIGQVTVGGLFDGFEKNKKVLRISQYSIKQASIEQIFNNFALQDHLENQQQQNPQAIHIQIPPNQQEMQILQK